MNVTNPCVGVRCDPKGSRPRFLLVNMAMDTTVIASLQHRRVVVVGLGYVGLPVAVRAVSVGYNVVGYDIDAAKVARLAAGNSPIEDVPDSILVECLATGRFLPTTDRDALASFDVAVISVPTPLRDRLPDLSFVEQAAELLAPYVSPGCCVILESTTYPGTTEELVVPRLEAGGLAAGRDFHVGYSPERIDPGNPNWSLQNTPKLTSGIDEASADAVDSFFGSIIDNTVRVASVREAEMAKLLENTFRHINIALVNELAIFASELDIDIWSVVNAAATKPFGFMSFKPGPGVGGHCLPIDPSYLSWQVKRSLGHSFRFVELANDVNEHMPDYVATRVADHLNRRKMAVNGSRILLIGLAYKPDSGDARESPALAVAQRLRRRGATIAAVDPFISPAHVPGFIEVVPLTRQELDAADLIVITTDHSDLDWDLVAEYDGRIFDTRHRLLGRGIEHL